MSSMRSKIIVALIIVLVATVLAVVARDTEAPVKPGVLALTNLPDRYCPSTAKVVVTKPDMNDSKIILDSEVAISECRQIELKKISTLEGISLYYYVKLPKALAFRLRVDSNDGRYQYAPSLGDVNNDNIIDAVDEQLVTAALLTTDPDQIAALDLDQDNKITVLDLSLTRIDSRIGEIRPDKQNWSQL